MKTNNRPATKTTEGLRALAIEAEFYAQPPEAQEMISDAQVALMKACRGYGMGWATSLEVIRAVGRLIEERSG